MFCFCFLFLTIFVRHIISKSTVPIFAKFVGLVEILMQIINLKLVFRTSRDVAMATNFCRFLSTELTFVTPVVSGAAGGVTLGFAPHPVLICACF